MSITLIDGSCLAAKQPTGVSIAVHHALKTGQFDVPTDSLLVTYGQKEVASPLVQDLPYTHKHLALPSKVIHAIHVLGRRDLSSWVPGTRRLLLPNLNLTHVPRVPYDLCVHDLSFLVNPSWFSPKTRAWHLVARPLTLIRGATRLFAVSDRTKRDLEAIAHVPASRITVLDLTSSRIPTQGVAPERKPFFLAFGGGDARKNIDVLLRAFADLSPRYPALELRILGRITSDHPRVRSLAYVSSAERDILLQEALGLLYPSWYEGFGLPMQEAHQYNMPCIVSSMSALPETAPPGTVVVPPFSPHLWRAEMDRLAEVFYRSSPTHSQNSLSGSS